MNLPERIDHYRVQSLLGEGGMGVVFSARDERLDREVAIKVVRGDTLGAATRERFWREARAAASLSHPHICQVFEVGEWEGQPFIVMELLDGEPVSTRLARGALPVAEGGRIVLGVLDALQALHQRGLVHRDLKPSNVQLTSRGVKLLDFGLVRPIADDWDQTRVGSTAPGQILGTPQYLAPEQLSGTSVDARTDLFAAGALLFELLSGQPAFGRGALAEVLHAVMYERTPVLTGSGAIMAVDHIVQRATAKSPADRYETAEAMAGDLRRAVTLDSGEVAKANVLTRLAVLPFRLLRPDPDSDFLSHSLADAVTISLAGLESLVVRSSLTTAKYAGVAPDLAAIAKDLAVDVVLSGTILRLGNRLRVTAQLATAPAGDVLWTHTAQGSTDDMFDLHDTLVRHIVESLPLTARDRARRDARHQVDQEAYDLYLRGWKRRIEPGTWDEALSLLKRSVERDPGLAEAWAEVGRMYRVLGKYRDESGKDSIAASKAALDRALALKPDLGTAHYYYAQLEIEEGLAEQAMIRLLKQAEQRRAEPAIYAGLVQACRYCGLIDESVAAYEHAVRLDPQVPTSILYTSFVRGDFERALLDAEEGSDWMRPLILTALGRHGEALAAARRDVERSASHPILKLYSEFAQACLGRDPARARPLMLAFQQSSFRDGEGLFDSALLAVIGGLLDDAMAMLDLSIDYGFFCFPVFRTLSILDPLRDRDEFIRLVERARQRHEHARQAFVDAGGPRVLGTRADRLGSR